MEADGLRLLEKLTQAHSVPGFEDEVREIFVEELRGGGTLGCDRMGSVFCDRGGEGPKVLVAGHMDEVGFRVQNILPDGYLRMVTVGGWWGHTLLSQRVEVKTVDGTKIIGTICSRPPHFLSPAERKNVLGVESMYVDIAARSRKEVEEWGISLGDPICPVSEWTEMHQKGYFLTKAFDNRVGMAGAIQVGQHAQAESCRLMVAGTVQEEVGLRGAKTLANQIKPDVAIVLEGPPADDTPGMPLHEAQGALGRGVQIRLQDPSGMMNPRLARFAVETARAEGIRHQVTVRTSGGTDAGSFLVANEGIPSVVLGTPARYIHSHNGIICAADYHEMVALASKMVERLNAETVASFTDYL